MRDVKIGPLVIMTKKRRDFLEETACKAIYKCIELEEKLEEKDKEK